MKVGQGYDVHALDVPGSASVIRLGGTDIPFDRALIAHSDGDVLIHALCDAILGALALGAQRLLPALQQIYASFTKLTFVGPSLEKLYDDLKNLKNFDESQNSEVLPFNKKITLKSVYYNYPSSTRTALKNINHILQVLQYQ